MQDATPSGPAVQSGRPWSGRSDTVPRLAAIVLLVLAWLPSSLLLFVFPLWAGLVVGLPSAGCFVLAYRRSGAIGNLVGVGLALATPIVWVVLLGLLLSGSHLD